MVLKKDQRVNNEVKVVTKIYLKTNDNEDTTMQNLWDAAHVVLRGKFMVIQAFLKKTRKISNKPPQPPHKRFRKRRTNKT